MAPHIACPSEDWESQQLSAWLEAQGYTFSHLPLAAVSLKQRLKNARLGTRAGVPDYLIVLKSRKLMFLELKRIAGGKLSSEQKNWLAAIESTGTIAVVCKGYKQAIAEVLKHDQN